MIGRLLFKPAPRVLIVDPAIHSLGGHHFVAMERLSLELDELSVPYRSLGASSVDSRVRKALGVSRCFSESIYGRTDWTKAEFRRRAKAMARDLARCVRWHRPNLVILPTCDQVLALALALAVNKAWSSWRPNVLLWLLFPPDRPGALEEYREAFSALRSVIGDDRKMHICCETNRMALAFADAIGIAIETHPGPNAKVMPDLGRPAGANGPIVACIGHASAAKGYQLLPGAIVRVLEENPRIRFNIHGTINARDVGADEAGAHEAERHAVGQPVVGLHAHGVVAHVRVVDRDAELRLELEALLLEHPLALDHGDEAHLGLDLVLGAVGIGGGLLGRARGGQIGRAHV